MADDPPVDPDPVVFDLVVITPFDGHNKGDLISDAEIIADALATNPSFVVQIPQGAGQPTPTPDGS